MHIKIMVINSVTENPCVLVDEKLIIKELGSKCELNQVMSSTNEKVLLGTDFSDMHRC